MSGKDPSEKALNQALTNKEKMFVERYLTHWNGAKAAREAGYGEKNCHTASLELRQKPYIKKAIAERMYSVCMETNEALGRLAAIARGDITDFLTYDEEDHEWKVDIQKAIDNGCSFLIKSYNIGRFGPANIELYSAVDALDKICKHLNLYKPDETNVNISLSAWAQFVEKAKDTSNIQASIVNGTFREQYPELLNRAGSDDLVDSEAEQDAE